MFHSLGIVVLSPDTKIFAHLRPCRKIVRRARMKNLVWGRDQGIEADTDMPISKDIED